MSDDTTPPEWLEQIPEPLRNAPFIGKAESVDDAVNKLAHAAQLVGTSVRIPGADASDDVKNQFYEKLAEIEGVARLPTHDDEEGLNSLLTKLGKPDEFTDYTLPEMDDFEWDETIGQNLREYALEAGMTKGQFTKFAQKIAEQEKQAGIDAQTQLEDTQKALRLDWGDTVEEREALIRGYLEHSEAPDSLKELLKDRNLPVDTMNWLYGIAKQFKGEVNPISRDGKSPTPAKTPEEIQTELLAVRKDLYEMTESDPRYKALAAKMVQLHKQLASSANAA